MKIGNGAVTISTRQNIQSKKIKVRAGKAPLYRGELALGIFDQTEQFIDATARNSFNMGWLNHIVASFRSAGDVCRGLAKFCAKLD